MMKKITFAALMVAALLPAALPGFKLEHRVFPADSKATLRFKPVSKWAKKNFSNKKLKLSYIRDDRRFSGGTVLRGRLQPVRFKRVGDEIVATLALQGEHEHSFTFHIPHKKGAKRDEYTNSCVAYTLLPDLFKCRPFKGEIHQHSTVSDGKVAPEAHLRCARQAGFDYIAITDHRKYEQNARIIKAAEESGSGLTIYPGEEIHTPSSILHAVCIGGRRSYSQKTRDDAFKEEVAPIMKELEQTAAHIEEHERKEVAEALAVIRRARKDGALVFFSHPSWMYNGRYNAPPDYVRYFLTSGEVDGVEIINGPPAGKSFNSLTIALLNETAAETGKRVPVISAGDVHTVSNIDLYRRNYNLLIAPDCSLDSFRSAIKDNRVVAVTEIDLSRFKYMPLCFGSSRMIRFALFLNKSGFWGEHDNLTRQQAKLIAAYQKGDKSLLPEIKKLAGEINAHREKLFCTTPEEAKPLR